LRALLQRVDRASVSVDGAVVADVGRGWAVLLGIGRADTVETARLLAEKIAFLRCFEDEAGKMNRSILDLSGEVLVVSQFTLYADTSRGRRPGFAGAAPPEQAAPLVERFAQELRDFGLGVQTGVFGAHMLVRIENNGPVTIWLDTDEKR
jgi:D-tyrosyl-tRNA(Tyr) deacylase